jgi:hypothetical protein
MCNDEGVGGGEWPKSFPNEPPPILHCSGGSETTRRSAILTRATKRCMIFLPVLNLMQAKERIMP